MDRITKRYDDEVYLDRGKEHGGKGEFKLQRDAYERLAAYEDTGLLPEEIADFQELHREMSSYFADYKAAEIAGRLVFLPCKVTDAVYTIAYTMKEGEPREKVVSSKINHVTISGETGGITFDLYVEGGGHFTKVGPEDIFRTREEAEKELEKRRDEQ